MPFVNIAIAVTAFAIMPWLVRDLAAPDQHPLRAVSVVANDCRFTPESIDATEGDRVRLTVKALDRPHSFVIREYRIARRASPGQDAVIDFLADKPGSFGYFSDLASDESCADMRGQLQVAAAQ